jgi:hypothetical protein
MLSQRPIVISILSGRILSACSKIVFSSIDSISFTKLSVGDLFDASELIMLSGH